LKNQYGLVLAGGMGWDTEGPMAEIKLLQDSGEKIVVTGYVDEDTRAYLYQNATLLAIPSHYEGFGMPLLEAMSYGVPVAASDIPVFHEVAGEAAVYFNKDDPASIASSLNSLISDESLRNQQIERSTGQLKKFDWDKIAGEVMQNFKRIVDHKK
jgi:glycosyltransferase involved in cell wall biosynthesis